MQSVKMTVDWWTICMENRFCQQHLELLMDQFHLRLLPSKWKLSKCLDKVRSGRLPQSFYPYYIWLLNMVLKHDYMIAIITYSNFGFRRNLCYKVYNTSIVNFTHSSNLCRIPFEIFFNSKFDEKFVESRTWWNCINLIKSTPLGNINVIQN